MRRPSGEARRPRGLERILSKAGVCSRRQARAWIAAGRVRVNGAIVLDPNAWFDPTRDRVELDGVRVEGGALLYLALNKPVGYLTTRTDPGGRATVYELLDLVDRWVIPVGRLDLDTSGLLLLTNDTQFAEHVTNPRSHVDKVYWVEVVPRLSPDAVHALERGVELHDGPTRPAHVGELEHRGRASTFLLTISEGRNRQVRRMIREVGSRVKRLERRSIGCVELGDLALGAVRRLTPAEVRGLSGKR